MYIEFISFVFILLIIGGVVTYYINANRKRYVLNAPNAIGMLRLLYMYKDYLRETDPDLKIKLLEEFEEALLTFLCRHEEVEEQALTCDEMQTNVKQLHRFRNAEITD